MQQIHELLSFREDNQDLEEMGFLEGVFNSSFLNYLDVDDPLITLEDRINSICQECSLSEDDFGLRSFRQYEEQALTEEITIVVNSFMDECQKTINDPEFETEILPKLKSKARKEIIKLNDRAVQTNFSNESLNLPTGMAELSLDQQTGEEVGNDYEYEYIQTQAAGLR